MPKKILVIGTNPEKYKEWGEVIHHPMIRLEPVAFERPDLSKYDWVIFTSKFAVRYFMKNFKLQNPNFKIGTIGKATAEALEKQGIKADLIPDEESSKGIIKVMQKLDLAGKKILIPRSNLGRNFLPDELRRLGAVVDTLVVYKNVAPEALKIDLLEVDEIVFSSPSGVNNFMAEYGVVPPEIKLHFIGEVTKNEFSKYQT